MAFLNTTTFPSPVPQEVSQAEIAFCDGLTENVQAALTAERARVQTVILGGTGATTAGAALTNLGAAAASDLAAAAALIVAAGTAIAQHIQFAVATGSAGAYVASPATPWASYAQGNMLILELNHNGGASATVNVSGLGAKPIYKVVDKTTGVAAPLTALNIQTAMVVLLVYRTAAGGYFELISGWLLDSADIPSTLGATTFSGDVTRVGGGLKSGSPNSYSWLAGGDGLNSGSGAIVVAGGINNVTYPGGIYLIPGNIAGATVDAYDKNSAKRLQVQEDGVAILSPVIAAGTTFTTICAITGNQSLRVATVTGKGSILLEWDGTTLTKLAGVASLVVAGSAGAGETAFRVSGGNLQAIVDASTRNVSSGFTIRH